MEDITPDEEAQLVELLGGNKGDRLVLGADGNYSLVPGTNQMQMSDMPTDPVQARSLAATQEEQKLAMLNDPNATLRGQARSSNLGEQQYQPLTSAVIGAASSAFPTAAGIVGGLVPSMLTRAVTANPWAMLGAGVAGIPAAIASSHYANKAQEEFLGPELQAKINLAAQQNPHAFKFGTVAPQVVAFKPSLDTFRSAARVGRDTVSALAGGGAMGPGVGAMLGNVGRQAAASGDIGNILGGAVGVGIPAGMAYQQYNKTGTVNPFEAGVDIAAGLLINKPHKSVASLVNKVARNPILSGEDFIPRAGDELRAGLDVDPLNMPKPEPDIPLATSRIIDNPEADQLAQQMAAGKAKLMKEQQAAARQAEKFARDFEMAKAKQAKTEETAIVKQAREEERLAKQMEAGRVKAEEQRVAEQVKMDQQQAEFNAQQRAQQQAEEQTRIAQLVKQALDEERLAKEIAEGRTNVKTQSEAEQLRMARQQAEFANNQRAQEQARIDAIVAEETAKSKAESQQQKLANKIATGREREAKAWTVEQVKMGQQKLDFEQQYNDALAEQGKEPPQYSLGDNPSPGQRISENLSPTEQSQLQNKLGTVLSKQGSKVTAVEGDAYSTTDDSTVRAGRFNPNDKSVEFATDNADTAPHETVHYVVSQLSPEGQAKFMQRVSDNADFQKAKSARPDLTPEEFVAEEGSVSLARQIKDKDFGLFRDLANIWRNMTGSKDIYDSMRSLGNVLAMGASKEGGAFNLNPLPAKPRDVGPAGVYRRYGETDKANIVPDTAETVRAQLALALDPASSRKAVLYTGEQNIGEISTGLRRVKTNHGTVDYNPRKISESAILDASNKGYEFDAKVLGMSASTKPRDISTAKVVSADMTGARNVQAEVVDSDSVDSAKRAAADAAPGSEVTVKDPEQVISERSEPLPNVQYSKLIKSVVDKVKEPDQRFAVRAAFNDAARLTGELGTDVNQSAGKMRKKGLDVDQLAAAYRSGNLINTPEAKQYYADIAEVANMANNGGVARSITLKPGYVPEIFSREATDILRASSDSPESKAIINELAKHWYDRDAAEGMAKHVYDQRTTNLDADFGPARKMAGLGLPSSVTVNGKTIRIRENDIVRAVDLYTRRLAKDLAWYRNVESKYGRDLRSEGMHDARMAFRGRYMDDTAQVMQQGMRAAGSLVTGTLTGMRNLAANPVQQAMYGGKDFPIKLAKSWMQTATAYPTIRKEAIKSGVLRAGANQAEFNPNVDNAVAHGVKTFIDAKRLIDGSTALEDISRVQNMAFGKLAAADYINQARKGNKHALKAMERFGVRPEDPEAFKKLAPVIATTIESTYDAREQPKAMVDSTLGDIMSIHKWGVEKMLTFNKDALQPALQGNFYPLFYAIAAAAGITIPAIEALNEFAKGRKGQPTLSEIDAAEDATKEKDLRARLAWFTDKLATAGLGGYGANLANAGAAALNGRIDVQPIFVPLEEEAGNIKKLFVDSITALDKDEPPMEVVKGFTEEALKIIFQAADPIIRKMGAPEEAARGSDLRDRAVYEKLVDGKVPPMIESNKLVGRREREYKESSSKDITPQEQAEMLGKLIDGYAQQYGNDPLKIQAKLKELKTGSDRAFPTAIFGDGVDALQATEAAKFMDYLYKAYGPKETDAKIFRAAKRYANEQQRKEMLP